MKDLLIPIEARDSFLLTLIAESIEGFVTLPEGSNRALILFANEEARSAALAYFGDFLSRDVKAQFEGSGQVEPVNFVRLETEHHKILEVPYGDEKFQWLDILTQLANDSRIPKREIKEAKEMSYEAMNELSREIHEEYVASRQNQR